MTILEYLLDSDPSIKRLVTIKLLDNPYPYEVSPLINRYLDLFNHETNTWTGIYSPKWISTFYTLRELIQFGIDQNNMIFQKGIDTIIKNMWHKDTFIEDDICVVAMMVSMLCYAKRDKKIIDEMIDYLLLKQMKTDGGWNCACLRHETQHSSINTTLSVLEAFRDYKHYGYTNQLALLEQPNQDGIEYLLRKKLYLRETTNEPILSYVTDIHFPIRWQYDLYRGLEYLASINYRVDTRMNQALDIVKKSFKNGLSKAGPKYSGKTHFKLDKDVLIKMNTLRGLSILKVYDSALYEAYVSMRILD
ncbi:MAG: hypothetical protein RBQ78_00230 [Acholeplasmataceae bacterium]|jgi:hypothetical protein|nr:hypothetical protein [Acholeplasmataceae bacterium]